MEKVIEGLIKEFKAEDGIDDSRVKEGLRSIDGQLDFLLSFFQFLEIPKIPISRHHLDNYSMRLTNKEKHFEQEASIFSHFVFFNTYDEKEQIRYGTRNEIRDESLNGIRNGRNGEEEEFRELMEKVWNGEEWKGIDRKTCVIDVGGGRGELLRLFKLKCNCSISLIEMAEYSFKQYGDEHNIAKYYTEEDGYLQIFSRFEDVDLCSVPFYQDKELVFIIKHLCDPQSRTPALENALRHITKYANLLKIKAILYSPCCNGKVETSQMYPFYAPYLSTHFSEEEFRLIVNKSSWATIKVDATRKAKKRRLLMYQKKSGQAFDLFLDYYRGLYLQQHGFSLFKTDFVLKSVTPKNRLYIAIYKNI